MDETAPLLAARDVHAGYGSNEVLHGVSMTIAPQTIVALLGHNGAGKTTFLRTVFGLHPMAAGTLQYAGESLPSGAPQLRVLRGIALVDNLIQTCPYHAAAGTEPANLSLSR